MPGLRELQAACSSPGRVTIAVIDGPADLAHPVLCGADMIEIRGGMVPSGYVDDSRQHGTHVASVLFGQPGSAVTGVAPHCRGLLIPVFRDGEDGGVRPCSELEMSRAILAALRHGANIINISAGRMSGPGTAGMHLNDAIRVCTQSGVLVVAAAGNDGCDCHQVPAALPGVLAVGAMDERGNPVGFSNWGLAYRKGGILAPGTDILGAAAGAGTVAMSGTSFATPIVSGVAALLMAKQIETGGKPDGQAVLAAILAGAESCDIALRGSCDRHLAGTLDVAGALRRIAGAPAIERHSRFASRSGVSGLGQRSANMDEQHGDVGIAPQNDTTSSSIEALAASLKAMEGMMGELSRTLGGLRPSGGIYATEVQSDAPGDRVDPAPEPARADVSLRPSGRRQVLRTSAPRDGDLLLPSACCDACAAREARQLVYALGRLGYDFGTEARFDSIQSQLRAVVKHADRVASVTDPLDLVAFLRVSPPHTPAITWTLNLSEAPLYAIRPEGDYLEETYKTLVDILEAQTTTAIRFADYTPPEAPPTPPKGKGSAQEAEVPPPPVERMSLPGVINGEVELMSGQVIPSVRPALGAMHAWSTEALVDAIAKVPAPANAVDFGKTPPFNPRLGLQTFLERIYEELRNVGLAPPDRALNFAATNAFQVSEVFAKMRGRAIHIEGFEVVRSPVMRPDSDCWDVKMVFFNPEAPSTTPREVYFFTIDVSDVVPVAIGKPRHWTLV